MQLTLTQSRARLDIALPVDVANKGYVLQIVTILKNRQDKIEKEMATLQNNMQIMINEFQKIQQVTTINK